VEELKNKVEKLASRVDELEEENRKLKQHISPKDRENQGKDSGISRRSFLKKLGAGAIGLGALTLSPASGKMKLTPDSILKNGKTGFLDLADAEPLRTNLDMNENNITGA